MKFIIYLTVISFIGFILLLIKAIRDSRKTDWFLPSKDELEAIYQEINESSPENIEINKTLKVLHLKKKLEQIEEQNIHQIKTDEENDKLKLNSPFVL